MEKGNVILSKCMVKVVCHDWPVICQCDMCCHLGCYSAYTENQESLGGGLQGCWLEVQIFLLCLVSPRICNNVVVGW